MLQLCFELISENRSILEFPKTHILEFPKYFDNFSKIFAHDTVRKCRWEFLNIHWSSQQKTYKSLWSVYSVCWFAKNASIPIVLLFVCSIVDTCSGLESNHLRCHIWIGKLNGFGSKIHRLNHRKNKNSQLSPHSSLKDAGALRWTIFLPLFIAIPAFFL